MGIFARKGNELIVRVDLVKVGDCFYVNLV